MTSERPATRMGTELSSEPASSPRPSWPPRFAPQHATVPSSSNAQKPSPRSLPFARSVVTSDFAQGGSVQTIASGPPSNGAASRTAASNGEASGPASPGVMVASDPASVDSSGRCSSPLLEQLADMLPAVAQARITSAAEARRSIRLGLRRAFSFLTGLCPAMLDSVQFGSRSRLVKRIALSDCPEVGAFRASNSVHRRGERGSGERDGGHVVCSGVSDEVVAPKDDSPSAQPNVLRRPPK